MQETVTSPKSYTSGVGPTPFSDLPDLTIYSNLHLSSELLQIFFSLWRSLETPQRNILESETFFSPAYCGQSDQTIGFRIVSSRYLKNTQGEMHASKVSWIKDRLKGYLLHRYLVNVFKTLICVIRTLLSRFLSRSSLSFALTKVKLSLF